MHATMAVPLRGRGHGRVGALLVTAVACLAGKSHGSPASFCVSDKLGFVTSVASSCPEGSHELAAAGVNLFDIAWGAVAPAPPPGAYNLSTSLKSIRDAGASGITVARFFASPWAYEPTWAWLNESSRPAYWKAFDRVVDEAARVGVSLIPSFGYGCNDHETCNPSRLCAGEEYRDMIVNASSCTRAIIFGYAKDLATRYARSPTILLWELGNELNLQFDACSYNKSDGNVYVEIHHCLKAATRARARTRVCLSVSDLSLCTKVCVALCLLWCCLTLNIHAE